MLLYTRVSRQDELHKNHYCGETLILGVTDYCLCLDEEFGKDFDGLCSEAGSLSAVRHDKVSVFPVGEGDVFAGR